MNFTGLKFKDGTEVKSGDRCLVICKENEVVDFVGDAIGTGLFRGHLNNGEDMVPVFMIMDTHYLIKEDQQ